MQKHRLVAGMVLVVATALGGRAADEPGEAEAWQRSVSVGLTATDGNSDTLTLNAGAEAKREWGQHVLRIGAGGTYAESQSGPSNSTVTTAQDVAAFANYKFKWSTRWYAYVDAGILHDDLADLDYRLTAGPGVGAFVIARENAELGVELGTTYIREERADDTEDDTVAVRIAARHDQTLSDTAKAWAAVEYLPAADDGEDYLLQAEAGVEATLNTHLSLRTVLENRYDNIPAEGSEKNDLSVVGALVYTL